MPRKRANRPPKPFHARTVREMAAHAFRVRDEWAEVIDPTYIWFRGHGSTAYRLEPSGYRNPQKHEYERFLDFQNYASAFLAREPVDEWEWYYLMQHYGMPTRLLDWTESLLVAIYFAVVDAMSPRTPPKSTPCVWMLHAGTLNEIHVGENEIAVPGGQYSQKWLPSWFEETRESDFEYDGRRMSNRPPIAIAPRRSNPRIVGQQGMFTVHGRSPEPIESVFAAAPPDLRGYLMRLDFAAGDCAQLLEELRVLGITRSLLFPELGSVAIDLANRYALSRQYDEPSPASPTRA